MSLPSVRDTAGGPLNKIISLIVCLSKYQIKILTLVYPVAMIIDMSTTSHFPSLYIVCGDNAK